MPRCRGRRPTGRAKGDRSHAGDFPARHCMGTDGLRDSSTLRLKATLAARGRGGRNARQRGMRCLNAPHVCTWLRRLRAAKGAINIRYGMPSQCVTPIVSRIDTPSRSAAEKRREGAAFLAGWLQKMQFAQLLWVWIVSRLGRTLFHTVRGKRVVQKRSFTQHRSKGRESGLKLGKTVAPQRLACHFACAVEGAILQRVRIPPGNCRSSR